MMGCIGSRLGHLSGLSGASHSSSSDAHYHSGSVANGGEGLRGNTFPVLNVDELGRHISPGKLEVTETELILYIQSKAPLKWPLRCLRRYGYENDLFSFESGRRCPTGPGIYAFKCTRAQSLFNLLQAKIQNNPSSSIALPPPQLQTNANGAEGADGNCGESSPGSTPGSVSPTFDYVDIAENSQLLRGKAGGATTTTSNGTGLEMDGSHPVYMNVENKSTGAKDGHRVRSGRLCNGGTATPLSRPIREINYAELDLQQVPSSKSDDTSQLQTVNNSSRQSSSGDKLQGNLSKSQLRDARATGAGASTSNSTSSSTNPSTLTYAILQPPNNNSAITVPHPHQPTPAELGYATIDFDRTAALSSVTRSKIKLNFSHSSSTDKDDDEDGGGGSSARKTRHNSTAL